MANEIRITRALSVAKGFLKETVQSASLQVSMSGTRIASGVQSIGYAAAEQIATTELSALGWAYFKNTDATNFVKIGNYSGGTLYPFVKLKSGEDCILRLMTGITIYAQADTGPVDLQYKILDD